MGKWCYTTPRKEQFLKLVWRTQPTPCVCVFTCTRMHVLYLPLCLWEKWKWSEIKQNRWLSGPRESHLSQGSLEVIATCFQEKSVSF